MKKFGKTELYKAVWSSGGGAGIRTLGASRHAGFQDQCFRPLSHPTEGAELYRPATMRQGIPANFGDSIGSG